ncbi:hypothetical protein HAX54_035172, partial [Datura stramonium]|nr:hypothetical protein [Datura stramonium]
VGVKDAMNEVEHGMHHMREAQGHQCNSRRSVAASCNHAMSEAQQRWHTMPDERRPALRMGRREHGTSPKLWQTPSKDHTPPHDKVRAVLAMRQWLG